MNCNILGETYKIILDSEKCKKINCDGFMDSSIKTIEIAKCEQGEDTLSKLDEYKAKVLRHEIIHAFLYESGLSINCEWATNEEMIDYFAIQFPKMIKIFKELEV